MANEDIRNGVKRKVVEQMAEAVKEAAAKSLWREPPVDAESADAGQIAKSAAEAAYGALMGPGVPAWFARAVDATGQVISEDELLGLDCVAALLGSTERAESDQKPAAMLLWSVVKYPGSCCAI